jgi:GntP family gluconate:H+ symporter
MHSIADAFHRKAVAAMPLDESVVKYWANIMEYTSVIGNANFALMISTVIAMVTLARKRSMTRIDIARVVEHSLMSGGVIILITSGGGAFGGMLKSANVGVAIEQVFAGPNSGGMMVLVLGFGVATIMKVAQGSGTVAMVTTATMLKSLAAPETLGFDPVYLAVAIGSGATCGSWMNDSGFWVVAKMGGLTEMETLKSWTILLLVLGITGFVCALIAVQFLPFPLGGGPLPATGG